MKNSKYISPIIGTLGVISGYVHGGGKTHPGACVPGGMLQFSADNLTEGDNTSGYHYDYDTIEGFSLNHLSGTGWYGDLGNFQVMPIVGEYGLRSGTNAFTPLTKSDNGWCSKFSHDNETASAGYYSVFLDRYNVKAEITVDKHSGMLRFTYPESNESKILFNLTRRIGGKADYQSVKITDNKRIEGYIKCTPKGGGFGLGAGKIRYTAYFFCEFSKPADSFEFFSGEEKLGSHTYMEGEDVGLVANFSTSENEQITLRIGLSYVDIEGAENNLRAEIKDFDFDAVRTRAKQSWENAVSVAEVEGSNEKDKTLFYTCLYHTLLDPRINVDVDGRYTDSNGKIRTCDSYLPRTIFSGWDVFRTEFPLLSIIKPDMVRDQVNTLIDIAETTNSSFPRWEMMTVESGCMVGDPAVIIIADAYVKGFRCFDAEKAYKIAKASCLGEKTLDRKPFHPIRDEADDLNKYHFVPGQLSITLEDLFADYALSRFAKALGKKEDAKLFEERSMWYTESFNPETGFMGPKDTKGNFIPVNDEYDETGCVESNILQQSFFVPHDIEGLIRLFGAERFEKILESFFEKADFSALWNNDYNHSNEPCHHVPHLFHFIGKTQRTDYWVRRVQKEAYNTDARGFCGNEDVGQLSAWYVLSAIGFGQVCPSVPNYQLNTPLFKKISIKLDKNYHSCSVSDKLVIECDADPLEIPYIKEVVFNGKKLDRSYLTFDEISGGGILKLHLSN